ncbi:hypothetical protein ACWYVZ_05175 [Pediococcus acidilactici]
MVFDLDWLINFFDFFILIVILVNLKKGIRLAKELQELRKKKDKLEGKILFKIAEELKR